MDMVKYIVGLFVIVYLVSMLVARSRRPQLPVWSIMAFAMLMVLTPGIVSVDEIDHIVDVEVLLFLIGMFSIVSILESSGVLDAIAAWFLIRFKSVYGVLFTLSLVYGILSAFTVNDALTLMGVPIAISISRALGVELKAVLILTAFSITIGSVMTPVGNPQNMLISSASGIPTPFILFLKKLTIPTVLNLFLTTFILLKIYKIKNRRIGVGLVPSEMIRDKREALLGIALFMLTVLIFVVNDLLEAAGFIHISRRGFIPFAVASFMYILVKNPRELLQRVSWGTILFFITMFITMEGIWRSGVLNPLLNMLLPSRSSGLSDILRISATSILLSQLLSNVPFTRLFITYMHSLGYTHYDVNAWITLATAATIAGNFTQLGAASNIIMLEVVERRGQTVSFLEFLRAGALVTIVNMLVYLPFIVIL
ncbi:MAG: SLC13 family permease [Ignisphaera sp.]|nr:SLC13 family permease [Ignisphaera sp.]MCX8168327.1 SLC13 family permease [Ignisphaera sp.]MDW8085341.1 SLC13 family permease [Ignisphaera sp.]